MVITKLMIIIIMATVIIIITTTTVEENTPRILLPSLRKDVILLRTARDTTAAPNVHHPCTHRNNPNVIILLGVMDTTAARNQNVTHLLTVRDTIAAPVILLRTAIKSTPTVVLDQHHHHHPVSFVRLASWVPIAVRVILILVVPLNVLPVETVV